MLYLLLLSACKKDKIVCEPASSWSEGTTIFVEKSEEWGLFDIGVVGTRIDAVDFNGDGYPDLFVRKNGSSDNFAEGTRSSWLLRNTGTGSFEDVTESSGIRQSRYSALGRPGQVVAFADVDNDGDLDVYTGYNVDGASDERSEILLNDGTGHFSLSSEENAVRADNADQPTGVSFVDFDHDGNIDLWLGQGGTEQDRLLKGGGDGSFEDVTVAMGLRTKMWNSLSDINQALAHTNSWAALACDLNNDGYAELLSASYGRAPNHLWRANGVNGFENQSIASGYAFDENTDWSDNESARCWCQLHPTDQDCDGIPAPSIVCNSDDDAFRWNHDYDREPFRLGGNSGATVCADLNNDGWMDLLTTEIVHWDVGQSSDASEILYNTQDQDVVFERPGNENTGLLREHNIASWNDGDITANVLDFDNDGRKDIYIGSTDYPDTRGLLYHQEESGSFSAVPLEDGMDHPRSHGVAVADFDQDGDLDMVVGVSSGRCDDECPDSFHVRFYENQLGAGNFVQVQLVGTEANGTAIGARVEVTTEDGTTQVQEVSGGFGHYGAQNDLTLHFGLGESCQPEVKIQWPDGNNSVESYNIDAGRKWVITQKGDAVAQ